MGFRYFQNKWLLNNRFPAVAIPALFLVISGITALLIHSQVRDLKHQASVSDRIVTSLLSRFILEHEKAALGILQSYAGRPLFIDSMKRLNVAGDRLPIVQRMIQAILEASAELLKEGVDVRPEIMVPQVGVIEELAWVKDRVKTIYEDVRKRYQIEIPFKFGTMIEVVRACMRANKLAEISEFFSFGTNDLTQATFSFSREDAEREFLPLYNKYQILQDNPFETLDEEGVCRLMMISVEFARQVKPDLKIGICGEHGGDPKAIYFCHKIGLSYVSASPHRVPIARLAAAHAVLAARSADKSL